MAEQHIYTNERKQGITALNILFPNKINSVASKWCSTATAASGHLSVTCLIGKRPDEGREVTAHTQPVQPSFEEHRNEWQKKPTGEPGLGNTNCAGCLKTTELLQQAQW